MSHEFMQLKTRYNKGVEVFFEWDPSRSVDPKTVQKVNSMIHIKPFSGKKALEEVKKHGENFLTMMKDEQKDRNFHGQILYKTEVRNPKLPYFILVEEYTDKLTVFDNRDDGTICIRLRIELDGWWPMKPPKNYKIPKAPSVPPPPPTTLTPSQKLKLKKRNKRAEKEHLGLWTLLPPFKK